MLRSLDVLSGYLFIMVGSTNEPPAKVPRVPASVLLESEGELDELIFTIHLIRYRECVGVKVVHMGDYSMPLYSAHLGLSSIKHLSLFVATFS